MKVAIIGGGAAGCFCAVNLKRMHGDAEITVFERANRPMAKLAITGGGRCNLTNTFADIRQLREAYPRGHRLMERLFRIFGPDDTMRWWEQEGVKLTVQEDNCVFPCSQNAMEIVGTLNRLMHELSIKVLTGQRIETLPQGFDRIIVTTGGSPRLSGLSFLEPLGLEFVQPVPSLFAFNIDVPQLHTLTGTVVEQAQVSLPGTKFQAAGPLLITHFGMSGPAILRLSSYAARHLAERNYQTDLSVNWMLGENEGQVRAVLGTFQASGKLIGNHHPAHLTSRHWSYLLQRAGIPETHRWDCLNRKEVNRLVNTLTNDIYTISGRRTHKAEFVTCGGVALSNLNLQTLALKAHPNIFMAGEVLDIDGITGGFNLQAAWTMGYVIAKSIATTL